MRKKGLIFTMTLTLIFLLLTPIKSVKASTLTQEQQIFINSVKSEALISYEKYNILPSLTISQAILESSWGKSTLSTEGNNLFGVKAYSDWTGSSISLATKEFVKGQYIRTTAKFKSYSTLNESIKDHSLLLSSERYLRVRDSKDYKEACSAIYNCGFATSPTYSHSLVDIIECYDLNQYDIKVPTPKESPKTPIEEASPTREEDSSKQIVKSINKLPKSSFSFMHRILQYNLIVNNQLKINI